MWHRKDFFDLFIFMYMYMSVDALRDQKKVLDSLELELQTVLSCLSWVLGTKLGSPEEQPAP